QRALDQGANPTQILDVLAGCAPRVPRVVMGYYNTVLRLGLPHAVSMLEKAKVSGAILSDLTPEESGPWKEAAAGRVDTIFLAAPTSTDERLDQVCSRSIGFVYAVSRTGVTSERVAVPPEARDLVRRIKVRSKLPVCVGFGISKPEHVRMICEVADGAVI